ncbi:MAG: hypothetical protein JST00_42415 [Deltaproteobacteria bacterium]|nr:hypothetical protein [Deltaproteobacteria bacterium]
MTGALLLGVATVTLGGAATSAEAADLRIVMQTNTPSPLDGYRYTDVQSVTLGDTGDLAFASRVRKDNDEKRVLFRESGSTVVPVAVPGAPRPGGGTWDPLSFAPLVFRGQWLVFGTGDASGATSAVFARGATEASTQPILTESVGGFAANKNRQIVALAGGGIVAVHPGSARDLLFAVGQPMAGVPGASTTLVQAAFVDDADRFTCVVIGSGSTVPGGRYVFHGKIGALRELPWFKDNQAAVLTDVGVTGSFVASGTGGSTPLGAIYVGAPEDALTEAFRFGNGAMVGGLAITGVDQVHAISPTSFAFIGREQSGATHAMVYEGGTTREIAGPGLDAPGTGQKFVGVREIGVNSKGQIVLRAAFEKVSTTGIFLYTPGKGVEYIAGRGTKIGAIDVGSVEAVSSANIDENGRVGFIAYHATQNITAAVATGKPGPVQPTGADLELRAEQEGRDIVFRIKNLGPSEARSGKLTISRQVLSLRGDVPFTSCSDVNGDTVCDLFALGRVLSPGSSFAIEFAPPAPGTRVEGYIVGASDPNLANNGASVVYQPIGAVESDAESGGCRQARSTSDPSALGGYLVGLLMALTCARTRRAASSRHGDVGGSPRRTG